MIVTDGIHVTSDHSLNELHQWAKQNNIKRHWFHGTKKGHPHYDIPYKKLTIARKLKQVRSRELLKASKSLALLEKIRKSDMEDDSFTVFK